jgi:hypothetical protein
MQWHPLFVKLLRPMVEDFYDVKTSLEVGDTPRQADLVLLRRLGKIPPFRGLWRHLTPWNILEYKGPSVSARLEHIDLLVELGLGIERRLNEEGAKTNNKAVKPEEVTFWYLANHLGRRFLRDATRRIESLKQIETGVWRGQILERPIFLVSITNLPVEDVENSPLKLLHAQSVDEGMSALRLTLPMPSLWELYSQVFESLHPDQMKEIQSMARISKKGPQFHVKAVADFIGMKQVVKELGKKEIINEIGKKEIINEIGKKEIINEIGKKEIINEIGKKEILDEVLGSMTPAELAALKRRIDRAERHRK